ncbi:MAG: hypothetical protein GW949_09570 [Spirochaetales bacterium]|nr:hypothetical protein [Spirochaetales bacterium]
MPVSASPQRKASWFVGASYGGTDDQTERFIREGIWQTDHSDETVLSTVRSIQAGDPIAIKSAFVVKKELPFDNRSHYVSVMAIKAVGVVTENLNDGHTLRIGWRMPLSILHLIMNPRI